MGKRTRTGKRPGHSLRPSRYPFRNSVHVQDGGCSLPPTSPVSLSRPVTATRNRPLAFVSPLPFNCRVAAVVVVVDDGGDVTRGLRRRRFRHPNSLTTCHYIARCTLLTARRCRRWSAFAKWREHVRAQDPYSVSLLLLLWNLPPPPPPPPRTGWNDGRALFARLCKINARGYALEY